MNLQTKVSLVLLCAFVLSAAAFVAVQQALTMPTFALLEQNHGERHVLRGSEFIQREVEHLSKTCRDWAHWDDTCAFVEEPSEGYRKANLEYSSMLNIDANLLVMLNIKGEEVHRSEYDFAKGTPIEFEGLPKGKWETSHPLVGIPDSWRGLSGGLIQTEHGLMMVTSHAILPSKPDSGPRLGTLIMGRLLTMSFSARLMDQVKSYAEIIPIDQAKLSEEMLGVMLSNSKRGQPHLQISNEKELVGHVVLRNLFGNPAAVLKVSMPRDIFEYGRTATRWSTIALCAIGISIMLIVGLSMRLLVTGPLSELTSHARKIANSGALDQRIHHTRRDELGTLSNEFNRMVERLATSQRDLVSASHRAGMAEVARGVIHNVGNVLNSAMVGASVASERLSEIRLDSLQSVGKLLDREPDDLASFLTTDNRGKKVPAYIDGWIAHTRERCQDVCRDLESVRESLVHASEIIEAQQGMAKTRGVRTLVHFDEVVDRSIAMVQPSLARHGITLKKSLDRLPQVTIDEHSVSQILVNLLVNAKDALLATEDPEKTIDVHLQAGASGDVIIGICDNGVGIPKEIQDQIFSLGFTTRSDGQGLGLHVSANAAREMGARIEVESEGVGRGARLTLTFKGILYAQGVSS